MYHSRSSKYIESFMHWVTLKKDKQFYADRAGSYMPEDKYFNIYKVPDSLSEDGYEYIKTCHITEEEAVFDLSECEFDEHYLRTEYYDNKDRLHTVDLSFDLEDRIEKITENDIFEEQHNTLVKQLWNE